MKNNQILFISFIAILLLFSLLQFCKSDVKTDNPFNCYFTTGSTLLLEDTPTKNVSLYIVSGNLTSNNAILEIQTILGTYYYGGVFTFTNLQSVGIQFIYTLDSLVLTINSVDVGLQSGDTKNINPYDTVQITWNPSYSVPDLISGEYANRITNFMVSFIAVFVPPLILSMELRKYKFGVVGFLAGINVITAICYGVHLVSLVFVFMIVMIDILLVLAVMRRGATT